MITQEDFERAIERFEKTHGNLETYAEQRLSYKNGVFFILQPKGTPAQHQMISLLFSDPIIHTYLTRDADLVHFSSDHQPILSPQEARLYRLFPDKMPCRGLISHSKYYDEGLPDLYDELVKGILKEANEKARVHLYSSAVISRIGDNLRKKDAQALLGNEEEKEEGACIDLFSNLTKDHATLVMGISDPTSKRVLCALLFDSQNNKYSRSHNKFSKSKPFRLSNYYDHSLFNNNEETFKKYLEKTFSIEEKELASLKEGATFINKEAKVMFKRLHSWLQLEKEAAQQDVDVTYGVYRDEEFGKDYYKIHLNRQIPFLNASHRIQIAKDDKNCVLYMIHFTKALISLLNQPGIEEQVIALSRRVASQQEDSEQAKQELVNLFKEGTKRLLPCFFDPDSGEVKRYSQLREFFLKDRWEMGNQSLARSNPIKGEDLLLLKEFMEIKGHYEKIEASLRSIAIDCKAPEAMLLQVEQLRQAQEESLQVDSTPNYLIKEKIKTVNQLFSAKKQAIAKAGYYEEQRNSSRRQQALGLSMAALGSVVGMMMEEQPNLGTGLFLLGGITFFHGANRSQELSIGCGLGPRSS